MVSKDPLLVFTIQNIHEDIQSLTFTCDDDYPDGLPKVRIEHSRPEKDSPKMFDVLMTEGKNSLGNVMIYNMISYLQEWLVKNPKSNEEEGSFAKVPTRIEEREKSGNTPVTPELFNSWLNEFILARNKIKERENVCKLDRLTGIIKLIQTSYNLFLFTFEIYRPTIV